MFWAIAFPWKQRLLAEQWASPQPAPEPFRKAKDTFSHV